MHLFGYSQSISVKNKTTLEGIEDVTIIGHGNKTSKTNTKGFADAGIFTETDTLLFLHSNYSIFRETIANIKKNNNTVYLNERIISLDEMVFSANKVEEKQSDVAQKIEIIKSRDVEFSNPQTTPDMLQNTASVLVQKSQAGGGSPVIRGFESNRVLIVIDGVRINNAIYRGGHLQDAMTIDNNILDRTEILFGPSSVIYGSDAIGGVMHFYTKKPTLSTDNKLKFGANATARYSSANSENTGHIDFNIGFKKIGFLTSITYSDFGDTRTGSGREPNAAFGQRPFYVERINGIDSMVKNADKYFQKFTGYKQMDITQKILFKINDKNDVGINFQYSTSSNIPRYDRLTDMSAGVLRFAEWNYGPQNRILGSIYANLKSDNILFNSARITAAFQNVSQERITRRYRNNNRTSQLEKVTIFSLNADFTKQLNEKHELRYGLESTYNDVNSTANTINIITANKTNAATRYPDGGSNMTNVAVYASHSWELNKKIIVTDGLRFSYIGLQAKWIDTTFFPFPFKTAQQQNTALNGSIGLILMPEDNVRFTLLASSGFRAPNVDDISKLFDSSPGLLIVPNPDLKPEYAYNMEAGFANTFADKRIKIEANYFFTLLTNAMVVKSFKYNGADSVIYDGLKSKVIATQNADEAYVQGISGTISADITDAFSIKSTLSYTHGNYKDTQKDTIIPMDHIPPIFGQTSIIHKYKRVETEFFIRYNGEKALRDYSPSGEDNLNYATPNGMPAWLTFNLRTAVQLTNFLRINVGVENLFDTHYRVFASGVSAPGRNIYFTLRAKF